MNRIAILSGILVVTVTLSALAGDAEIARLKQVYDTAAERALAPLKANYERELRRVLDEQMKAGNQAAAAEANAEIEKLTGKPALANGVLPGGTEHFFVNHTWSTPGGTDFRFTDSGKGERQYHGEVLPFTWRLLKSGFVETKGAPKGGSNVQTTYFRFTSDSEGSMGLDTDHVNSKLIRKK